MIIVNAQLENGGVIKRGISSASLYHYLFVKVACFSLDGIAAVYFLDVLKQLLHVYWRQTYESYQSGKYLPAALISPICHRVFDHFGVLYSVSFLSTEVIISHILDIASSRGLMQRTRRSTHLFKLCPLLTCDTGVYSRWYSNACTPHEDKYTAE